jgi:hypothetical protein
MRTLDLHHPSAWWRQWRTDHPTGLKLGDNRTHTRAIIVVSGAIGMAVAALFVLAQFGILSGY